MPDIFLVYLWYQYTTKMRWEVFWDTLAAKLNPIFWNFLCRDQVSRKFKMFQEAQRKLKCTFCIRFSFLLVVVAALNAYFFCSPGFRTAWTTSVYFLLDEEALKLSVIPVSLRLSWKLSRMKDEFFMRLKSQFSDRRNF